MKNPNGYGSIYKLSGKRRKPYTVRLTEGWDVSDGRLMQHRITLGYYATRKDAMKALSEYHSKPYSLADAGITLSQLYDRWSEMHYKHISDGTLKTYKAIYKHYSSLYDVTFRDIRTADIQRCVDDSALQQKGQSIMISIMYQLFEFAIQNDLCDKNYAKFCRTTENTKSLERLPFTEDEICELKKIADTVPYADTVLMLIYTGWRVQEFLNLRREDIDLDAETMTGGLKTKSGKNRIVPIHPVIMPYVVRALNAGDGLTDTTSYWIYRQHFDAVCKLLGTEHTPHDTRHTFATRADQYGMNHIVTKRILGHSTKDITEKIYTHKYLDDLKKEIRKVE